MEAEGRLLKVGYLHLQILWAEQKKFQKKFFAKQCREVPTWLHLYLLSIQVQGDC